MTVIKDKPIRKKRDKTYQQLGLNPIEGWTDEELISFWDRFIVYNLTLLSEDCSDSLDILDWLNGPEFLLVANFAGLDGEFIRENAIRLYEPKPKKVRRGFTHFRNRKPLEVNINGFIHYAFDFGD
ncbi:hypothetical protein H5185_08660 [Shewanella sp. SG44-6]|jgi:hypothetical protein|uniref:hypothetical protein n=1 Tax=Shewanella sp. SG44-6 TaxID=2760959 RepID=UPI0015FF2107|nr:hypothetical protein [Shewanella sp. SG44-6]MBB1389492.1 hypothetical protein [Shewanella sp. SG44-6]